MAQHVTFDIVNKLIIVTQLPTLINGELTVVLDFKIDIYSDGKKDWQSNLSLRRRPFPIRPTGGDELPGAKSLGSTFFLDPDWKIQPYNASHRFIVSGNIYSEDGTSPFNSTIGDFNVFFELEVSSLTTDITSAAGGASAAEVWAYTNRLLTGANDANITDVLGIPITSIDDFKADISLVPADVWSYATRTLTETLGLTPAQEAKLDQILLDIPSDGQKTRNTVVAMS